MNEEQCLQSMLCCVSGDCAYAGRSLSIHSAGIHRMPCRFEDSRTVICTKSPRKAFKNDWSYRQDLLHTTSALSPPCCIHEPVSAPIPTLSSQAARLLAGQKTNTLSIVDLEKHPRTNWLATKGTGGKLEEWIPKVQSSICATLAEKTLELPIG